MKYIVFLLMALINVPFFPNIANVFSCGFSVGILVAYILSENKH